MQMTISHSDSSIYMTIDDVASYLRVKSNSTIYRWVKQGKFPEPIKLNGLTRWDMKDVAKWVVDKKVNE